MAADLKNRVEALSPGELTCLRLVAQHRRSAEIAFQLGLSVKTVDGRISRAMRRLGVADRDSAVRLLMEASQTPWGKTLAGFPGLDAAVPSASPRSPSRFPWPWPTHWRPENDHSIIVKVAIVLTLAAVMMIATALYLLAVLMIDRATVGRDSKTENSMSELTIENPRRVALRAGRAVTQALLPHENDLDTSIVSAAVLVQRIAQARLDMNVPAATVQPALNEAASAIGSLIQARHHIVASHALLTVERDQLGFTSQDFGCTPGKASRNAQPVALSQAA